MHAVITEVAIAPGQFENARKDLTGQVVPRVSKAPGFVKAYWTIHEGATHGSALIVFRTKQDADMAVTMIRSSPMTHGVTLNSAEVCEIVAEA